LDNLPHTYNVSNCIKVICIDNDLNCQKLATAGDASLTDYLYTGQQFDATTGHYHLRARQYDPSLGRFLSMDTWPLDHANPVELNRYVYAAGNPVMFSDPSGYTITGIAATHGEISGRNIPILSGLGTVKSTYYAKLTFSILRKWARVAAIDWLLDQLDILDPGDLPADLLDITINQLGADAQVLTQAEARVVAKERERILERVSDQDWDFVGYHGTATRYVPHIVAKIDPPRTPNSGANQLGHGFYVMPWQDPLGWATAQYFVDVATGFGGEPGTILLIFALDFKNMSETQVPPQHWNDVAPPWTKRYPEAQYSGYDYLTAPFNDPGAPGSTQIKFNPHIYQSYRLFALPIS
jgi:RHS repeat-associated protein